MIASQISPEHIGIPAENQRDQLKQARESHSFLPKVQQKILENLGCNPVSVDALTIRSGLSVAEINSNLVLLEVDDYIRCHPGGTISLKSK